MPEAWMASFDPAQVAAARDQAMNRGRQQMN
jgi:enoyl-CoA hydratase